MAILASFLPWLVVAAAAAQELPVAGERPLDYEPQLILRDPGAAPAGGVTSDLAKMENGLQRARRDAQASEQLYQRGILAKLEAERAAMKVLVLSKKLSDTKLQLARDALAKLTDAAPEAKSAATLAVQDAEALAQTDAAALQKAQIEAAALNLWRTQKLQGWGSASKAAVARAQEQLSNVQAGAAPAAEPAPLPKSIRPSPSAARR